jgi:hypothetical protein
MMNGLYLRLGVIFAVLTSALAACQSSGRATVSTETVSAPILPSSVQVSGQADGAPPGCSPQDVANRLIELFDAIGRGDPNVVPDFFDGPQFAWYGIGEANMPGGVEKNRFVAHSLEELPAYFTQRHEKHEQVTLRELQVNGWEPERGLVHFGPVVLYREADDLRGMAEGKGAYHCETQTFAVLSLASYTTP